MNGYNKDNNLICANHNRREIDQNPISHAEILVLEEASQILGTWRLEEITIAVTLEPDAMCAGAILNARIRKLIYGASNLKAGAAEIQKSCHLPIAVKKLCDE